ncbi:PE-PPE domain-containing protein [Thalassotalea profundi]|uniref:PE-PPE domain-containing protein n=1 Tax=Thalassotalea profundi TaxID=2036687 RepID=A0ABQ3IXC3_9GAMM|nr:PE-PPE domain-containing protein [Thalassotalea profundi]GHE97617.1 hypothetical protein GCM10011501_29050 [Thalassotalea profundi]
MNKIIEKYLDKAFGSTLLDDLRLVLDSGINLLDLLNTKTIRHPESEINFRKQLIVQKVKAVVSSKLPTLATEQSKSDKKPRVLFINGIVTPYSVAKHQADILNKAIRQDVALIYNETDGLFQDLLECNQGRSGVLTDVAQRMLEAIEAQLLEEGELTIVAYSQGAIISTSALIELAKNATEEDLSRIRYITFGAGFKTSVLSTHIYCEHFANSDDPVTWLGLQHIDFPYSGELFIRQAKGHFLIADYLIPMMNGATYGDSWFEKQIHLSDHQTPSSVLP